MVLPPPDCADEPLVVAIDLLPAEKDRGVRQSSLDVGTGDRRLRRVGHHRPIGDAVVLVARSRVVVELVIAEHTDVLGFQEKVETLEREGLVTNDGTQCRGVSALVSDRVVRDGLNADFPEPLAPTINSRSPILRDIGRAWPEVRGMFQFI